MTALRLTDPRFTNPQSSDPNYAPPTPLRNESAGGVWGWIAGLAVVALIAFVVIAGWNNAATNTADTAPAVNPAPITTGSGAPIRNVTPQSTTGSGSTSPMTNPNTMTNPAPSASPPASGGSQQ